MGKEQQSLQPVQGGDRALRARLDTRGEIALAALPTVTVMVVLILVENLGGQRLLFASLASSAFLIYLDPLHGMNTVRSLLVAHALGTGFGLLAHWLLGPGYLAGGVAMLCTILLMILLDAVHPPAVSTALTFGFREPADDAVLLFGVALGFTVVLVILQRAATWLLGRVTHA